MEEQCLICGAEFTEENPFVTVKKVDEYRLICKRHPHPKDLIVKEV